MSKLVKIDARPGDGLALLTVDDCGDVYAGQLWARCNARKAGECDDSGRRYRPGALVYRPVGNPSNRSMRILAECIDQTPDNLGSKF